MPCCAFSFAPTKMSKLVCTRTHAASGLFSRMEHGAPGICKSPVCAYLLDHVSRSHSSSSEGVAEGTALCPKRLVPAYIYSRPWDRFVGPLSGSLHFHFPSWSGFGRKLYTAPHKPLARHHTRGYSTINNVLLYDSDSTSVLRYIGVALLIACYDTLGWP